MTGKKRPVRNITASLNQSFTFALLPHPHVKILAESDKISLMASFIIVLVTTDAFRHVFEIEIKHPSRKAVD
jgi:hypothetical protein